MESPLWLLYALLSAVFAAFVAIFGKIGLEKIDTTLATTARAAVMFVFLLTASAALGKLSGLGSINNRGWFYIVLAGLSGALSWLFYFWALRRGTASHVAAVDRLSLIFVIFLAAFFLGEKFDWRHGIGALLMLAGAVLMAVS